MATYFAKSALMSKTHWFNAANLIIAIAEMTEVTDLMSEVWLQRYIAIAAIVGFFLRQYTVRPVAMIAPGEVMATHVDTL